MLLVNIAQAQYDMVFEVILSYHLVKERRRGSSSLLTCSSPASRH